MVKEIKEIFKNCGLEDGRSISWSKSAYEHAFPSHKVYFGAKVYTIENGLIWVGDLDMDFDTEKLKKTSEVMEKTIYILKSDEQDDLDENEIINKSISKIEYK